MQSKIPFHTKMNRKKHIYMYAATLITVLCVVMLLFFYWNINTFILPHGAILRVFQNSGNKAVILCPGGAYSSLAKWREGYLWVPFFLCQGYTIGILEYRMPHQNYQIPITDASEALNLMRHIDENQHNNNRQVGMMGFSAGGHLVSTIAVKEELNSIPDFIILFYPLISMKKELTHKQSHDNLIGPDCLYDIEEELSSELHITNHTPPTFLAVSKDDKVVKPSNSYIFYREMKKRKRPATLRTYTTGGHGWGYYLSFKWHRQMVNDLSAWLKEISLNKNDSQLDI